MLRLEIEDNVTPTVRVMGDRLENMSIPLERILEDGLRTAQARYTSGEGFVPQSPATVRRMGGRAGLFQRTGALAASLERGGSGNLFLVGRDSGEAGSDVSRNGFRYGAAFQSGTSRQPARPFLFWSSDRMTAYDEILIGWVSEGAAS